MPTMRLQRFLAQGGIAARRKAELLIDEGRVKVNGVVIREAGTKVDPEVDRVSVDGQPVHAEELYYIIFNKPKACITALSDPEGRRTVMEYMPGLAKSVVPVGRLDFYSEGVLMLTNDGSLAAALTSSKFDIEKVYHIKLKGSISDREIAKLEAGVKIDDRAPTKPAKVTRLKSQSRHDWLEVTITEGKNRQLHRMLEAVGHEITKLQRVSFAGISYQGLRVGDARELEQNELKALYALTKLDRPKGLASRGKWAVKRETTEKARRASDRKRERVTPNLTPGGSKKAKTKLLTRYREQEEDGTNLPVPVPQVVARAAQKPGARPASPRASVLVAKARPRPKRGEAFAAGGNSSAGRPSAGRPSAGRPSAGRPSAGRPSAGRPSSGKPGGSKPGGSAGPRKSAGGAAGGRRAAGAAGGGRPGKPVSGGAPRAASGTRGTGPGGKRAPGRSGAKAGGARKNATSRTRTPRKGK